MRILAFHFAFLALAWPAAADDADERPVLRRCFAEPRGAPAVFAPDARFEPRAGETIAFAGGTDTHEIDRHGYVETAFHLAWPDRDLRLRNLAWQGDTVFYQARPKHFFTKKGDPQPGSIPDHRERVEAGIVFIQFGKMESLEGAARLPDFLRAYAALLDQLEPLTKRIVLTAPTPFFPTGPAGSLAETRNATLRAYSDGIRELAAARGLRFLDLKLPARPEFSENGTHLTAAGHRALTEAMSRGLGFPASPAGDDTGALSQSLRQAIERKNRLWWQYHRPSNWAFLFGDRQHVPASRDPENRDQRWFVREIDAIPGLIAATEADIHRYAREARSKP